MRARRHRAAGRGVTYRAYQVPPHDPFLLRSRVAPVQRMRQGLRPVGSIARCAAGPEGMSAPARGGPPGPDRPGPRGVVPPTGHTRSAPIPFTRHFATSPASASPLTARPRVGDGSLRGNRTLAIIAPGGRESLRSYGGREGAGTRNRNDGPEWYNSSDKRRSCLCRHPSAATPWRPRSPTSCWSASGRASGRSVTNCPARRPSRPSSASGARPCARRSVSCPGRGARLPAGLRGVRHRARRARGP